MTDIGFAQGEKVWMSLSVHADKIWKQIVTKIIFSLIFPEMDSDLIWCSRK